ncbi:hypothetical protein GF420_14425 [candidate division GN15 bacterium]|nr:hypothetical protein [candidate division GN15 bacterium]
MELTGRIARRIALLAVTALILPLAVFPEQFGMQLGRAALVYLFYEVVYYGFVAYLFHRRGSLIQLAQVAGMCLVFRLALGAVFGLIIAAMYGMHLSVSLALGLSSYLPVVVFHVAVTPFILKPIVDQIIKVSTRRRFVITPLTDDEPEAGPPSAGQPQVPVSNDNRASGTETPMYESHRPEATGPQRSTSAPAISADTNGFERAVRYIGEHGSVYLAAIIDSEGLLMANFYRGEYEPDDWAPLALLFYESNQRVLARNGLTNPDRVDLRLDDRRVVTARQNEYSLMVVADRQSDDVLNIRISQGLEIIAKYVTERYASMQDGNAERTYVSGTE